MDTGLDHNVDFPRLSFLNVSELLLSVSARRALAVGNNDVSAIEDDLLDLLVGNHLYRRQMRRKYMDFFFLVKCTTYLVCVRLGSDFCSVGGGDKSDDVLDCARLYMKPEKLTTQYC